MNYVDAQRVVLVRDLTKQVQESFVVVLDVVIDVDPRGLVLTREKLGALMLHEKLLGLTNALEDIKDFGLLGLYSTTRWTDAAWIWFWSESFVVDYLNWMSMLATIRWTWQHSRFMKLLLAPVHEAQPFMLLLVLIGLCTRQRSCYLRVPESRVEDANAVASSTCSLGWVIISAFAIIRDLFALDLNDLHGVLFDVTFIIDLLIVILITLMMETDQIQISIQKVSGRSFIAQTSTLRHVTLPRWPNWHRLCWWLPNFSFVSLTQDLL